MKPFIISISNRKKEINMKTEIIEVNLNAFKGTIPPGFDLVEYERGTDPLHDGYCLHGFHEVGMFFPRGIHCFMKIN
jgi:hypothetical protein